MEAQISVFSGLGPMDRMASWRPRSSFCLPSFLPLLPPMGCTFSGLNALYDVVNGGSTDVWINETRFRIVRTLGEGGFSSVYLVKEQPGGRPGKQITNLSFTNGKSVLYFIIIFFPFFLWVSCLLRFIRGNCMDKSPLLANSSSGSSPHSARLARMRSNSPPKYWYPPPLLRLLMIHHHLKLVLFFIVWKLSILPSLNFCIFRSQFSCTEKIAKYL